MTIERRVRRKPGENRALLIQAAITVFGTHGYHGASTSEIARVADVPQPHVYQHFRSKWELFFASLEEAIDHLQPLENAGSGTPVRQNVMDSSNTPDALARLYVQAVTLIPHPTHGARVQSLLARVQSASGEAEWERLVMQGLQSLWAHEVRQ